MQPAIAEPPALGRERTQPLPQIGIIRPRRAITHALAIRPNNPARPPLAHPQAGLKMRNGFPHRGRRHHSF
jgi:hypothetical protein